MYSLKSYYKCGSKLFYTYQEKGNKLMIESENCT